MGMGFGSRELHDRASKVPHFVNALTVASGGARRAGAGWRADLDGGEIIGAVGISGDTSDNDEICCLAASRLRAIRA